MDTSLVDTTISELGKPPAMLTQQRGGGATSASAGTIAGAVVGSVVGVALLAAVAAYVARRRRAGAAAAGGFAAAGARGVDAYGADEVQDLVPASQQGIAPGGAGPSSSSGRPLAEGVEEVGDEGGVQPRPLRSVVVASRAELL